LENGRYFRYIQKGCCESCALIYDTGVKKDYKPEGGFSVTFEQNTEQQIS